MLMASWDLCLWPHGIYVYGLMEFMFMASWDLWDLCLWPHGIYGIYVYGLMGFTGFMFMASWDLCLWDFDFGLMSKSWWHATNEIESCISELTSRCIASCFYFIRAFEGEFTKSS